MQTSLTNNGPRKIINYLIAAVWLVNGLFCKVLNLVPRHQQIVAIILDTESSRLLTVAIGWSEVCMAAWIISERWKRLNVAIQTLLIATMNTLEVILVPDLLLWGRANVLFAFLLICLIIYNEYYYTNSMIPKS